MNTSKKELQDLREKWPERLDRVLRIRQRIDPSGMTRPPRDPVERDFLERTGQLSPFVEQSRES